MVIVCEEWGGGGTREGVGGGRTGEGSTAEVNLEVTTYQQSPVPVLRRGFGEERVGGGGSGRGGRGGGRGGEGR